MLATVPVESIRTNGADLAAVVNYPNQKAVLLDFLGADLSYLAEIKDVAVKGGILRIRIEDILKHIKYNDQLPPPRGHKHGGLINTLLYNAPRALRILYEVVESVIKQQGLSAGEDMPDAKSKIWSQIREDLSIPALYRVPYLIQLIPPPQATKPLHALRGEDIGHLVELRGLVSRVSPCRPLIEVAVYHCTSCNQARYHHVEGTSFMPLKDCGREGTCSKKRGTLKLSLKDSKFVNYQQVWIQELPQNVPSGKVPLQLKLSVKGSELCNRFRPGRPVKIVGLYVLKWNTGPVNFRSAEGPDNYPIVEVQDFEELDTCSVDLEAARRTAEIVKAQVANSPGGLYHILAESLAPTIHGHDDVKKALVLQLVGGVRLDDKVRGSIHILLVGDPGIAKSQLLLRIGTVSPRSKYTCGRGASGVGLTACVVKDSVTGEFSLEAGATVLSDKGICCIDEFDKMNETDRTAIHEVMEQQTVSISKAGIVATLNARTSILAAANPVGGRYNVERSMMENVGLPAALMSRFDFIFLMLDECTERNRDINMAKHLLQVHKNGGTLSDNALPTAVVRELVSQAQQVKPYLPKSLHEQIIKRYVAARHSNQQDTYITARTLTGLLRVSQALAKLRFDAEISLDDIIEAERLLAASKASVAARRLEKRFANIDPGYRAAKDFLMANTAEGQVYEYEIMSALGVKKRVAAADFDAVLNDLVREGVFSFCDVSCSNFKRH